MDHVIADATEADAELLASIIRRSFADVAQRFGLTPESAPSHPSNCTPEWIDAAFAKGVRYYILRASKEPVGCIALEHPEPDLCYLGRLAVLPPLRRHGLGRALVDHAVAQARQLGASRVVLGIISAQAELRAWYEGQGFSATTTAQFEHLPFEVTLMLRVIADNTVSQAEPE